MSRQRKSGRLLPHPTYLFWSPLFIAINLLCINLAGQEPDKQRTYDHRGTSQTLPIRISFNAHIRPVMSNTCFVCHGPDENANNSGMRLDSSTASIDESGVISPGDSADSAVFQRIIDVDDPMPPSDFRHQLSEYEKALFKKWIDQGAPYQKHWSYAPVSRPDVPDLSRFSERVANPVDSFVLNRLEMENITPTPTANKSTLLRRLSLDLTGLPPTPKQLDDFLSDESDDAYEKQVDRLLSSPEYGERMATRWLDIVRFSDTVGFHGDQNQRIFPYRDFVINSINTNQPFDQFTRDQLASDLLENPTDEQLVATGLIRLNMMTREGGAQPGEYLAKYAADRVRMIGTAWLGATTGCCECHNHKYDPFTTEDFYSLGAFFKDVRQWGVYQNYGYTPNPDLQGFSNDHPFPPELRVESRSLKSQINYLEQRLDQTAAALLPDEIANSREFESWLSDLISSYRVASDLWHPVMPGKIKFQVQEESRIDAEGNILFPEKPKSGQVVSIPLRCSTPVIVRSVQLEVLPSEIHGGNVGRSENGGFSVSLSVTHLPRFDRPESDPVKMIPVQPQYVRIELTGHKILSLAEVQIFAKDANHPGPVNIAPRGNARQSSVDHLGEANRAIDENTSGNYADQSTTHTSQESNPWWELDLGQPTSIERIVVWNRTDGNYPPRLKDFRVLLLDADRNLLFQSEPDIPSPSVLITVPSKVSEFDLLPPETIAFVQADRHFTNRYSNGRPSAWVQGDWKSGPMRWQLPENETSLPHTSVYHLNKPVYLRPDDRLMVSLRSSDVGRIRFSVSPVSRIVAGHSAANRNLDKALSSLADSDTFDDISIPEKESLKSAYYHFITPADVQSDGVKQLRNAIAECRSGLAWTMISQPIESDEVPTSRVLPRGNWQDESGKTVVAKTPVFLTSYQGKSQIALTRLDLADWLTSKENPLTARHYVNRTWKHFFGAGLSNVLDDLGNQGEWPSHPELLDWMASEFQENWDRKHISRLIVTSNTYRQRAAVRTDLIERDPYNRLLAQQSPRRLEAEAIRDNALAIAGLLQHDWIGGPSVFPYQPPGYYSNLQFPNRRYTSQTDGRQYRRGIYMHWQRTFLHPMLSNFDAPSRDECTADRTVSNSPQQALTLLNDPVFVEASRAFADRLLVAKPNEDFF